jgi:hypothetical protein
MKPYRLLILFIINLLLIPSIAISQTDTVKYTPEFEFKDGFYFSFSQVKQNDPIPGARLISDYDHNDVDFYNKILDQKHLAFFDKNGVRQQVPVSKLWGFSRNGVLYIKLGEGFHRITIVGSICHFVATVTTYNDRYYDPYYGGRYGRTPYYDPYSPYNRRNTRNSEMRQYLLDFESGKVMDYDFKSIEVLLMKDPELHDEFAELRKRKKKQLKFYYLRKFNERNPLYIPVEKRF